MIAAVSRTWPPQAKMTQCAKISGLCFLMIYWQIKITIKIIMMVMMNDDISIIYLLKAVNWFNWPRDGDTEFGWGRVEKSKPIHYLVLVSQDTLCHLFSNQKSVAKCPFGVFFCKDQKYSHMCRCMHTLDSPLILPLDHHWVETICSQVVVLDNSDKMLTACYRTRPSMHGWWANAVQTAEIRKSLKKTESLNLSARGVPTGIFPKTTCPQRWYSP